MPEIKHRAVTDKYRVRRPETVAEINKYYMIVSKRYMRAKFITIIILVVFFAFMMFRFNDDITYSNLMYLLRDFDTDPKTSELVFEKIEYDEQENMNFTIYKGELAIMGNRTLKMYNSRGVQTRSYESELSDPVLIGSDKYLFSYGIGSPSYSLYTSIARVKSGEAPGDIEYADINNRGEYLFVCRSKDTKYVICTYDSSFKPIAQYYKTRYVTSSAIGDDGRVIVVSFDSDGGAYNCEVELYYDGSEKPDSVYETGGVFPLKCGVWKNGNYYVVCSDRILFFDNKGNLISTAQSAKGYTSYSESDVGIVVTYANDSLGGSSTLLFYDTKGSVVYSTNVDGSITSAAVSANEIYALAGTKAYMFSVQDGSFKETKVNGGGASLLSYGDSCVICYKRGAEGLVFGDDTLSETVKTGN